MDPVLRPLIEAPDEPSAEAALERLIEHHALPLANAIAARKLRSFGTDAAGPSWRDRDDVVADAMVTLVERLRAARDGSERSPIESFERYTAAVVHSACAHYIRRRCPARARLKSRLRYICSTDSRLAMWSDGEGGAMCGLAGWSGAAADPEASRRLTAAVDGARHDWNALTPRAMAAAVASVARAAGGPVAFESLVGAVADASGIVEPVAVGVEAVPPHEPSYERAIDQRRALATVWQEVAELPVRQRSALMLNLRDASGSGVLWLLPILGIATVREIARVLEIAIVDFARIWRDIPLDDAAIAERLGCTRQQVINLRMAARKRLHNRVGRQAGPTERPRGSGANLTLVSASLRDST